MLEQCVGHDKSAVQQPGVGVGLGQQCELVGEQPVRATDTEVPPPGLEPQTAARLVSGRSEHQYSSPGGQGKLENYRVYQGNHQGRKKVR